MLNKIGMYGNLLAAEMTRRAAIVKIKINGVCVNKCTFCPFHSDKRKLEVTDLARLFDMMERPHFSRIDINGGEPTIHPRFEEIADYLGSRFRGRVALHLGTNLIPFLKKTERAKRHYAAALRNFDMFSVGCDDEHHNIDHLETLAPEIVGAGKRMNVNVVDDFCSPETRRRILAVKAKTGIRVMFSGIHHFKEGKEVINDVSTPCNQRTRELLVNCNGEAFFCFHQEHQRPMFNLHTVTREELNYYLELWDPAPYDFCPYCQCYKADRTDVLRKPVRKLLAAAGF